MMNDPTTIRMLRYLEGRASAGEVAELNALLLADREARAQFLQLSAQAQALHELTAPDEKRAERTRRLGFLAGMAALLLLGAFFGRGWGLRQEGMAIHAPSESSGADAELCHYPLFCGVVSGSESENVGEPLPLRLIVAAGNASPDVGNSPGDTRRFARWFARDLTWDDLFESPLHYPAFVWATELAQGEIRWPQHTEVAEEELPSLVLGGNAAVSSIESIGLLRGPPLAVSGDASLLFAL